MGRRNGKQYRRGKKTIQKESEDEVQEKDKEEEQEGDRRIGWRGTRGKVQGEEEEQEEHKEEEEHFCSI